MQRLVNKNDQLANSNCPGKGFQETGLQLTGLAQAAYSLLAVAVQEIDRE
jgi:hypothetical protein